MPSRNRSDSEESKSRSRSRERAGRPSREDRDRARITKKKLGSVDKEGRTRRGRAAMREIAELEGVDPAVLRAAFLRESKRAKPPTKVGSKNIYSGKSRNFQDAFARDWWRRHPNATCCECNVPLTPKNRSIDHIEPWSRYKLGTPTQTVCKDGIHYEVALTKDVYDRFQDERNLQPACKSCNSSMGGTKGDDGIGPRRLRDRDHCMDGSCRHPKAR